MILSAYKKIYYLECFAPICQNCPRLGVTAYRKWINTYLGHLDDIIKYFLFFLLSFFFVRVGKRRGFCLSFQMARSFSSCQMIPNML